MTLLLLNLVDNAVKYGGTGPIAEALCLAARQGDSSERDRPRLGIAPTSSAKIFERFIEPAQSANTNIRGSGIGLALVKPSRKRMVATSPSTAKAARIDIYADAAGFGDQRRTRRSGWRRRF